MINSPVIVGIDEVGRGAWAGPLLVAAVVLGGLITAGLTIVARTARTGLP